MLVPPVSRPFAGRAGRRRTAAGLGVGVLGVVLVAGCAAAGSSAGPPRHAAVAFVHAIVGHDGAGACAMLTTNARSSVTGATEETCEHAVLQVDETDASVGAVQVWGDSAQVEIGSDTVFLLRLRTGWRVDAAGCRRTTSDAPYDCDVNG